MSPHPDHAALEAYVLGHHDEIDQPAIEQHVESCERCLDEVAREARLEMLLHVAGREDVFASVLAPTRPRGPLVAAAAIAVAAVALYILWPRATTHEEATSAEATSAEATPAETTSATTPELAGGGERGAARCSSRGGDLTCTASAPGATRKEARTTASDKATEALVELALLRGGPAIVAQRSVYATARSAALRSGDREETRRRRHEVASRVQLGRRDQAKYNEFNDDCTGANCGKDRFHAFVRFTASEKEIAELLARYRVRTIGSVELVPIVPGVRWALDPGDDMAWFVHQPGGLAALGIRAGDVLLHDQRRNANGMHALVERGEVRIWRDGKFR